MKRDTYFPALSSLSEIERLFDLDFPFFGRWGRMLERDPYTNVPATDVYEDGDHYYVRAELPGVRKEDVTLKCEKGVLSIEAKRHQKLGKEERTYHFERALTIPEGVDHDAIKASFEDGMLTVTLPKAEAHKPRRIEVR